jgi:transcriptional regulator with XRE-family HTH domain
MGAKLAATMGEFARKFGKRIKSLRNARGMSQESLAEAANLHRTHISLIERARRSVRLETIERLALALEVQPSELLPSIIIKGRPRTKKT